MALVVGQGEVGLEQHVRTGGVQVDGQGDGLPAARSRSSLDLARTGTQPPQPGGLKVRHDG